MTKKNKTEEFKLDRNGTPCFVIFESLDEYEDKGANVVVINSIYYDEKKTKNRVAELQKKYMDMYFNDEMETRHTFRYERYEVIGTNDIILKFKEEKKEAIKKMEITLETMDKIKETLDRFTQRDGTLRMASWQVAWLKDIIEDYNEKLESEVKE